MGSCVYVQNLVVLTQLLSKVMLLAMLLTLLIVTDLVLFGIVYVGKSMI
jgi:hypothetical protein